MEAVREPEVIRLYREPRAFMPMTRKHSVSVTDERRKSVSQRPQE